MGDDINWLGTAIVILILLVLVGLVIFKLVRDHREGTHGTCTGDCSSCSRGCSHSGRKIP